MTTPPTRARNKETALRVILGLAVVLMLLVPFGLFLSELAQAHRQYVINTSYVPVRAMIMASSVERYKGSKGAVHYAPNVRYRYEVSGKTHESDNLMAVYVSGDEEWAQSIVDRYQAAGISDWLVSVLFPVGWHNGDGGNFSHGFSGQIRFQNGS